MNDPVRVRGIQGIGDFDSQRQENVQVQQAAGNSMLQSRAVQKFHDDERLTILLSDFIDSADIGVVQRGSRLRFALKTGQSGRVLGYLFGEKLDRHKAVRARVPRLVDNTPPPATALL